MVKTKAKRTWPLLAKFTQKRDMDPDLLGLYPVLQYYCGGRRSLRSHPILYCCIVKGEAVRLSGEQGKTSFAIQYVQRMA